MRTYRSRILECFTEDELREIKKLTDTRRVTDNNKKGGMLLDLLRSWKKEFLELGSGTNRIAVLMKGYVFKFALDNMGVKDNDNEFALSPQLYPYVIKTYETNGIVSVCEYIEKIVDKEEFSRNRGEIMRILSSIVKKNFLIGDVGFTAKNFCNWGRRKGSGEACILDFAYMYKIDPRYLACPKCTNDEIDYDPNFVNLVCMACGKTITFTEMRKHMVPIEDEDEFIDSAKADAMKLNSPLLKTNESGKEVKNEKKEIIYEPGEGNCRMNRDRKIDLREDISVGDETLLDLLGEDQVIIDYTACDSNGESTGVSKTYLEALEAARREYSHINNQPLTHKPKFSHSTPAKKNIVVKEEKVNYENTVDYDVLDEMVRDALDSIDQAEEEGYAEGLVAADFKPQPKVQETQKVPVTSNSVMVKKMDEVSNSTGFVTMRMPTEEHTSIDEVTKDMEMVNKIISTFIPEEATEGAEDELSDVLSNLDKQRENLKKVIGG
jgi:hypothetical protein